MKVIDDLTFLPQKDNTLYPTWFRWKPAKCKSFKEAVSLYIPHGSDESYRHSDLLLLIQSSLYPTWFRWKSRRSRYLTINISSLYPTWFRWKARARTHKVKQVIFISHMVQMKDQKRPSISIYLRSLYPTWFRWKLTWQSFILHLMSILYIPHGSDESCGSHLFELI